MKAVTADVRKFAAAAQHTSIVDTHRGQGALWRMIDRVNAVVGQKQRNVRRAETEAARLPAAVQYKTIP